MVKLLNILFVEDDAIEVMMFNRVIQKIGINHKLIEASNGENALEILNAKEIIPDIILLDLNMPKLNGIEFLKIIKNNEALKHVPIIIFTTSNNHRDISDCYKIGIAGYIIKPLKYDDYLVLVQKTLEYWSCNELM
ncbi:response regulator [Flavobacterium sp.]|uniref:response regulator n=1 Tax=Flavobacterium sp. TaxID=239 RepID=UPI003BDECE52